MCLSTLFLEDFMSSVDELSTNHHFSKKKAKFPSGEKWVDISLWDKKIVMELVI